MMPIRVAVRGCSSKRDAVLVLAVFTLCVSLIQTANAQGKGYDAPSLCNAIPDPNSISCRITFPTARFFSTRHSF